MPDPPSVDHGAEARDWAEAPGGSELARQVAAVFAQVLRVDDVGPDDDLFHLGGHSLSVTQMAARIRGLLGVEVPLSVFFSAPTVAGVASWIVDHARAPTGR